MRQGQLGQFLGAHPRAGAAYNRAVQRNGGRAQQIGLMNTSPGMTRQQARMTLGQASGGRPRPIAGQPGGGLGGLPGGGMSPAPPTMQPMPPGAQQLGNQTMSTLGGMGTGNPYLPFGNQSQQGYGGGGGAMPFGNQSQQAGGGGGPPPWMQQQMPGQTAGMGNYTGSYAPQSGLQSAMQGLMGSVNPGMQSVIGNRLGQMGYGGGGMGGSGMQQFGQGGQSGWAGAPRAGLQQQQPGQTAGRGNYFGGPSAYQGGYGSMGGQYPQGSY